MSALDLFASALGAFILIFLVLAPYYLKKSQIRDMDIVFVMDTTGSMRNEIEDLNQNLLVIVEILKKISPRLHIGFVAYRDDGKNKEEYVTKEFQLREMSPSNIDALKHFVKDLKADGGDDFPEALNIGLLKAIEMPWRASNLNIIKVIVVIGDAPPHDQDITSTLDSASNFASQTGKYKISTIYTNAAKGNSSTATFFLQLSKKGRGDYVLEKGRIMESILLSALDNS